MHGVLKLRKMIQDDPDMGWRDRYDARGTEEIFEAGEGQDPLPTTPQGPTASTDSASALAGSEQDTLPSTSPDPEDADA
jgi:hypothetical protein